MKYKGRERRKDDDTREWVEQTNNYARANGKQVERVEGKFRFISKVCQEDENLSSGPDVPFRRA